MVLAIGCILITISIVLFILSYRLYSYRGLLQTGKIFVRVLTPSKVYYGWVKRNDVTAMDRITGQYQWFLELTNSTKYVIKYEEIKEIKQVSSPITILFKSSYKVK